MNAPTVRQIVTAYQNHCDKNSVHGKEARIFRERVFKLFLERYGDMPVTELRPFHLFGLIESQSTIKSPSTRKCWAVAVKAAFQWACDDERISRNPVKKVKYQESPPRPLMEDSAFVDVCNCGNKRFECAVRFLRWTGCRLSEMAQLTWHNVNFEKGLALIEKHKSRRYTQQSRVLVLPADCIALLRQIREKQPPNYDGIVFLNNRDRPWDKNTLSQTLLRMKKRGLVSTAASLHGLRHAFCHHALANGAPAALVSQAAGHAVMSFTVSRYGHLALATDAIRGAVELAKPVIGNG